MDLTTISTSCLLNAVESLSSIINARMKFFINHPSNKATNILISKGTLSVWIIINSQLAEEAVAIVTFTIKLNLANT